MFERARELQPYVLTAAFLLLWLAEACVPHHSRAAQWWRHACTNLLLTMLYIVAAIGFAAVNAWIAHVVLAQQLGLLNWFHPPAVMAIPAGVLALDMAAYAGHIVKHRLPLFWRFHQVHHSDQYLDVTTGFRFHPVEGLISWLFVASAILLMGIPAAAILAFTGLYSLAALVQHANLRWPTIVDRTVRLVFVSPRVHWVHHSPHRHETNSNYGTLFSFWDRLFGTYQSPEQSSGAFGLGMDDPDSVRATLWSPCAPSGRKDESLRSGR